MRALQRPDTALEPVHKLHFVGQSPEQGLGDVHVGLNESGNDDEASGIDDFVRTDGPAVTSRFARWP